MNRLLSIACLVCVATLGNAQTWQSLSEVAPDSGKYLVGVRAIAAANSTTITTSFTNKLVQGGLIEPAAK